MRAIDTHTHFYDPTRPEGVPWPSEGDAVLYRRVMPEEFRRVAGPCGVTGTVVIEASAWVEDNQWLLDLARDEPTIQGVIGRLDPDDPNFAAHFERFAADPLFRGLRLGLPKDAPPDRLVEPGCQRALALLARQGLTLDLLCPWPAPGLLEVLAQHPDLRIVLDHTALAPEADGRPVAGWQKWLDAAPDLPHVYWKISGFGESAKRRHKPVPTDSSFYRAVFDAMLDRLGPTRLLYASNWPVCEHAMTYEQLFAIVSDWANQLDAETRDRVFYTNAVEAYGPLRELPTNTA